MEEVIKKIIQIEEKAQNIIDTAEQEVARMSLLTNEKIQQIERDYEEGAKRKIESIRQNELGLATEEVNRRKEICDRKIKSIEKQYQENVEKWTKEIVASVLKR